MDLAANTDVYENPSYSVSREGSDYVVSAEYPSGVHEVARFEAGERHGVEGVDRAVTSQAALNTYTDTKDRLALEKMVRLDASVWVRLRT